MVPSLLKWRKRRRNPSRLDILLAVLYAFELQEIEEISLSEVTESILELQKIMHVGYDFPQGLFYSYTLSEELRELQFGGYLHYYEYRHDGFLPLAYFRLTLLGREKGRRFLESSPYISYKQTIVGAVTTAIERDIGRWGLFARRRRRVQGNIPQS